MTAPYTVELRAGETKGTVVGTLTDTWGWVIEITATREADGTYRGTGTLAVIPDALRVPLLDGGGP